MIFVIKVYIDWLKKPFITEKYDFFTYLKIQRDVYGLASLKMIENTEDTFEKAFCLKKLKELLGDTNDKI